MKAAKRESSDWRLEISFKRLRYAKTLGWRTSNEVVYAEYMAKIPSKAIASIVDFFGGQHGYRSKRNPAKNLKSTQYVFTGPKKSIDQWKGGDGKLKVPKNNGPRCIEIQKVITLTPLDFYADALDAAKALVSIDIGQIGPYSRYLIFRDINKISDIINIFKPRKRRKRKTYTRDELRGIWDETRFPEDDIDWREWCDVKEAARITGLHEASLRRVRRESNGGYVHYKRLSGVDSRGGVWVKESENEKGWCKYLRKSLKPKKGYRPT